MTELADRQCVPCKGDVPPLRGKELQKLQADLPKWTVTNEHHLHREFRFPDFKQALEFVNTGIDFLAPAFGNIHGAYGPKGPRGWLEFERLEKVRKAVEGKVKIVLHGTNAFDQSLFQECIRGGITKINVNKQLIDPWRTMMEKRQEFTPVTKLMEESIEIFQREVERLMDECGSSGKA